MGILLGRQPVRPLPDGRGSVTGGRGSVTPMQATGRSLVAAVLLLVCCGVLTAQPRHGVRPERLVIRGATVVEGNGTPASGPLGPLTTPLM